MTTDTLTDIMLHEQKTVCVWVCVWDKQTKEKAEEEQQQ